MRVLARIPVWTALFCAALAHGAAADSGFRPQPHGFSFENWGDDYPHGKLTIDDARRLFGDRVCVRWQGDKCTPTPAARLWLREMNKSMEDGHCEGMAVLSALLYRGQETPGYYGGRAAYQLGPENSQLLRSISTYFTTQFLEPVASLTEQTREMTPSQIAEKIQQVLKDKKDYLTLGIYGQDGGGHAITPFAVETRDDGSLRVMVYDNNYPGAEKYLEIDPASETWSYAGAALNPSEDPEPWEGGTGTMDYTLNSWRLQPMECPFCDDDGTSPPLPGLPGTVASAPTPETRRPAPTQPVETPAGSAERRPFRFPQPASVRTPAVTEADEDAGSAERRPFRFPLPSSVRTPAVTEADAATEDAEQAARPPSKPVRPVLPRGPILPSLKPRKPGGFISAYVNDTCDRVQVTPQAAAGRSGVRGAAPVTSAPPTLRRIRGGRGCYVRMPSEADYILHIGAAISQALGQGAKPKPVSMTVFRPGSVYHLDGITVKPGETQSVQVGASSLSFIANGDIKPVITVATSALREAAEAFYEISGVELGDGHRFSIAEAETGELLFQNDDPDLNHFDLVATVSNAAGDFEQRFNQVNTGGNHGQLIFNLRSGGVLDLETDTDADGYSDDYDPADEDGAEEDPEYLEEDETGVIEEEDAEYLEEDETGVIEEEDTEYLADE